MNNPNHDALQAAIAENVELSAECEQLAERVGLLIENALLRRQLNAAAEDAAAPIRRAFIDARFRNSTNVG